MRRITATLAVTALALAACGGDDDDAAEEPAPAEAEAPADEPADEPATEPADEPAAEPADEPADEDDSTVFEDDGDDDDGDTLVVSRLGDIPQVCRDLMEDFLNKIEPIVSPIDWENGSMADFETIAEEFDPISAEFDAATEANEECSNIELDDDENLDLLIEFAGDVAPGTVGFMTFISGFASAAGELADEGEGEDIGAIGGDAAFEDCAGAIEWIQGLVEQYDSIAEAPVADLMQIANLGNVFASCTPEQLEVLNGPEVQDFLAGL